MQNLVFLIYFFKSYRKNLWRGVGPPPPLSTRRGKVNTAAFVTQQNQLSSQPSNSSVNNQIFSTVSSVQQKLFELEAKQQAASAPASVSEWQLPVSTIQSVFGMPTLLVLNQQVDIPSKVQNRNILWTPVTSAGISLPLPLESCCSVSIVSQHHASFVAQACPNYQVQCLFQLLTPVPVSLVLEQWNFVSHGLLEKKVFL